MIHGTAHRFLIVRLGSLGDVIHGIPVAAALRERYPSARIDWLVDPRYMDVLALVQGLDVRIPVDPRRSPRALITTLRDLRRVRYTAAIDLQGLVKSAALARAAGAWHTIGQPREQLREPLARAFYTQTPDTDGHPHVIHRNLALLRPLGAREMRPAFPLVVPATPVVQEVQRQLDDAAFAVLNPGAAWPNKRWPPVRFGQVAAALAASYGLRSVVSWGPGEHNLAQAVVESSRGAAIMAPHTSAVDLFALARAARLVIAGDTGPLHIAAAVSAPIVALFGPTIAERNGPWAPEDIVISTTARCACLYRRRCRTAAPCIDAIPVEDVVAAAARRLAAA